ncbi:MAG: adenosine-specific kinase [bacterium]
MDLQAIQLDVPHESNLIFGQTHFIKSVEDLSEILRTTVPGCKFGLAFCEASGPCLIRHEGNDPELLDAAIRNAQSVGCGHIFFILLKEAFPINVLPAIKACQEVCTVFCATANPVQAVVLETAQGRGVMGVVDGSAPKGVEKKADQERRKEFLRKIGYKA